MFPTTYYAKLDASYRQALLKLENDLSLIEKDSQKLRVSSYELVLEFSSNYLTPNTIWDNLWEIHERYADVRLSIVQNVIYHFSSNDIKKFDLNYCAHELPRRMLMDKESERVIHGHFNKRFDIEDLCFPHSLLEYYLYSYETVYPKKHLPQKIVKCNYEMRNLYEKIKAVEGNEEEWIKAMEEVDDIEYVKHNVEYKLGQDLTNKKLWISYIKYLKEYDIQM